MTKAPIRPPNAGKGRPKGAKNKTTLKVKEALNAVYDKRGGDAALLRWSEENPTEFYKLWGRQLPQELTGADGGPVEFSGIIRSIVRPD